MKEWKFQDINFYGCRILVEGVNIWKYSWERSTYPNFKAPHPQYQNQTHIFTPYLLRTKKGKVHFAASEVSNCVWCIYAREKLKQEV